MVLTRAAGIRGHDRSRQRRVFVTAGVLTGLALLAKTEMGMAAVVAGMAAAVSVGYPDQRRVAALAALFAASAILVALVPYALLVARIGWGPVLEDSWLLLYNMPPEIAYFNGQISGLGRPARSLTRMGIAAAKLGIIGCFIAALSTLIVSIRGHAAASRRAGPGRRCGGWLARSSAWPSCM